MWCSYISGRMVSGVLLLLAHTGAGWAGLVGQKWSMGGGAAQATAASAWPTWMTRRRVLDTRATWLRVTVRGQVYVATATSSLEDLIEVVQQVVIGAQVRSRRMCAQALKSHVPPKAVTIADRALATCWGVASRSGGGHSTVGLGVGPGASCTRRYSSQSPTPLSFCLSR